MPIPVGMPLEALHTELRTLSPEICVGSASLLIGDEIFKPRPGARERTTEEIEEIIQSFGNPALAGIEFSRIRPTDITARTCTSCGHCVLLSGSRPYVTFDFTVEPGKEPCIAINRLPYEYYRQATQELRVGQPE